MNKTLTVAVPRLASTILLLAQNPHRASAGIGVRENDIQVLMMKRHSKARFMPSVYVFPGGGVDVADYTVAHRYLETHFHVHTANMADTTKSQQSFMEVKANPTPEEGEAEAWACRMGALRELAEEAGCVLHRKNVLCTAAQWRAWSTQQRAKLTCDAAALQTVYDVDAAPTLRPVGRWVTPRHFKYRYDTYFYAALVGGPAAAAGGGGPLATVADPQDVPLTAQASEVAELLWLSPLHALRRHENASDTFSLAPPTFLLLHALARQPSFTAVADTWASTTPSYPGTSHGVAEAARSSSVGTLPYSSLLPCVEPRSFMTKDKKHIADFLLPEHYFYERGWSEPQGAYRFCGEAFDSETHTIRMWVGAQWALKVEGGHPEVNEVAARELAHL